MDLALDRLPSPMGEIWIVADAAGLRLVHFADYEEQMEKLLEERLPGAAFARVRDPHGARTALERYLSGDISAIDALPVSATGTGFQQQVWRALRTIPAGTTLSYSALAERVGRPKAARAVGYANSLNPVAIVVPCHRVVGADESLTGYAGGLHRKRWLLNHELAHAAFELR
jgi:methylated-DNA-[protein]-cysteine S-methyltransferase